MKKYLTGSWKQLIKEVDVEKETASSVWINGQRFSKETKYQIYHDSFDDAKNYLLNQSNKDIATKKHQLAMAEKKLLTIKNLKA